MEKYNTPVMELIELEAYDIIMTSGRDEDELPSIDLEEE
jgi:hypothetical protein